MRRRRQDPADPESVAALAVIDAYDARQETGGPHTAWLRREIREGRLDPIIQLAVDVLADRNRETAGRHTW